MISIITETAKKRIVAKAPINRVISAVGCDDIIATTRDNDIRIFRTVDAVILVITQHASPPHFSSIPFSAIGKAKNFNCICR